MQLKIVGAVLVVAGCGGWGLLMANAYRKQEMLLRKLTNLLRMMQWELRYRLTSLPELCTMAARDSSGVLRDLFRDLARELDSRNESEAAGCMNAVLSRYDTLPPKVRRILRHLGRNLGRFDLEGQLEGMFCVIGECKQELQNLRKDRELRIRSYQTLTLCAGFALVIIFL